jgi:hypothetical protein
MKQAQKIENYRCLEAGVQRCNEGMAQSKDQSLLFRDDVRYFTHVIVDAGLLKDLQGT